MMDVSNKTNPRRMHQQKCISTQGQGSGCRLPPVEPSAVRAAAQRGIQKNDKRCTNTQAQQIRRTIETKSVSIPHIDMLLARYKSNLLHRLCLVLPPDAETSNNVVKERLWPALKFDSFADLMRSSPRCLKGGFTTQASKLALRSGRKKCEVGFAHIIGKGENKNSLLLLEKHDNGELVIVETFYDFYGQESSPLSLYGIVQLPHYFTYDKLQLQLAHDITCKIMEMILNAEPDDAVGDKITTLSSPKKQLGIHKTEVRTSHAKTLEVGGETLPVHDHDLLFSTESVYLSLCVIRTQHDDETRNQAALLFKSIDDLPNVEIGKKLLMKVTTEAKSRQISLSSVGIMHILGFNTLENPDSLVLVPKDDKGELVSFVFVPKNNKGDIIEGDIVDFYDILGIGYLEEQDEVIEAIEHAIETEDNQQSLYTPADKTGQALNTFTNSSEGDSNVEEGVVSKSVAEETGTTDSSSASNNGDEVTSQQEETRTVVNHGVMRGTLITNGPNDFGDAQLNLSKHLDVEVGKLPGIGGDNERGNAVTFDTVAFASDTSETDDDPSLSDYEKKHLESKARNARRLRELGFVADDDGPGQKGSRGSQGQRGKKSSQSRAETKKAKEKQKLEKLRYIINAELECGKGEDVTGEQKRPDLPPSYQKLMLLKTHLVHKDLPNELLCTICEDMVQHPTLVSCCQNICCAKCVSLPNESCKVCNSTHSFHTHCEKTEEEVKNQIMHCPAGCGWYGKTMHLVQHYRYFCPHLKYTVPVKLLKESTKTSMTTSYDAFMKNIERMVVKNVHESDTNTLSVEICEEISKVVQGLAKKFDTNRRKICNTAELDLVENVIQHKAKHLEELTNTVSDNGELSGGIHQTFSFRDWPHIMEWINAYARAFYGNAVNTINCVDFGAGVNIPSIVGAVMDSSMSWAGVEIDVRRIRLGVALYKILQLEWYKQFDRHLPICYMRGDCSQPMNTRGTDVAFIWDRAHIDEVVYSTFNSLARCYTHPFLLIMSNCHWYRRKQVLCETFNEVQVVGRTGHFRFRGNAAGNGDSLVMAVIASPNQEKLKMQAQLHDSSYSINDFALYNTSSREKTSQLHDDLKEECDNIIENDHIRNRRKQRVMLTYDKLGEPTG